MTNYTRRAVAAHRRQERWERYVLRIAWFTALALYVAVVVMVAVIIVKGG